VFMLDITDASEPSRKIPAPQPRIDGAELHRANP